jgi:HEAT repeat protein
MRGAAVRIGSRLAFVCAPLWALWLAGCGPRGAALYARLQDEDPVVRARAAIRAGQVKDPKAVPFLVDRLDDEDEVVRFCAILSLERITGKTMGYEYYGPRHDRTEAVERWRRWLDAGASRVRTDAADAAEQPQAPPARPEGKHAS